MQLTERAVVGTLMLKVEGEVRLALEQALLQGCQAEVLHMGASQPLVLQGRSCRAEKLAPQLSPGAEFPAASTQAEARV
jgi:hypothetical protein